MYGKLVLLIAGASLVANACSCLPSKPGFDELIKAWVEFDTKASDGRRKPWLDWKRWVSAKPLPGTSGDVTIEIQFEKWVLNGDRN